MSSKRTMLSSGCSRCTLRASHRSRLSVCMSGGSPSFLRRPCGYMGLCSCTMQSARTQIRASPPQPHLPCRDLIVSFKHQQDLFTQGENVSDTRYSGSLPHAPAFLLDDWPGLHQRSSSERPLRPGQRHIALLTIPLQNLAGCGRSQTICTCHFAVPCTSLLESRGRPFTRSSCWWVLAQLDMNVLCHVSGFCTPQMTTTEL